MTSSGAYYPTRTGPPAIRGELTTWPVLMALPTSQSRGCPASRRRPLPSSLHDWQPSRPTSVYPEHRAEVLLQVRAALPDKVDIDTTVQLTLSQRL